MGRYQGTADKIAGSIAAERREAAERANAVAMTAENMSIKLEEFAEDMAAALKRRDLPGQIEISPWKEEGAAIIGSLIIRPSDHGEIRLIIPIGDGNVTVNGKPIERGGSVLAAVNAEVYRLLREIKN